MVLQMGTDAAFRVWSSFTVGTYEGPGKVELYILCIFSASLTPVASPCHRPILNLDQGDPDPPNSPNEH